MKHGVSPSTLLAGLLAGGVTLALAGFLIFAFDDSPPRDNPSSSIVTESNETSSPDNRNVWLWVSAVGAAALGCMFWYFRRAARKSSARPGRAVAGGAREHWRMQAADQVRDALAIFNRQAFEQSDIAEDLAPLYGALVSARIELQKRNVRFMYDAVGASHIQAVQQMLTEMEDDLGRQWPRLSRELRRLADLPAENGTAGLPAETVDRDEYNGAMTYLRLLRTEIREELVHLELRYRRLLCN